MWCVTIHAIFEYLLLAAILFTYFVYHMYWSIVFFWAREAGEGGDFAECKDSGRFEMRLLWGFNINIT